MSELFNEHDGATAAHSKLLQSINTGFQDKKGAWISEDEDDESQRSHRKINMHNKQINESNLILQSREPKSCDINQSNKGGTTDQSY